MKAMTESNMKAAFAGESQAHMKYLNFARKAKEEGFPNVARLFEAIAFAEQVHASNHMRALGDLGPTVANLQAAINGENFEVEAMYPAYAEVAELEKEKQAGLSIHYALEAEKIHAVMYAKAKEAVEARQDPQLGKIQICSNCGYTVEGEAPDRCPVCGLGKDQFRAF